MRIKSLVAIVLIGFLGCSSSSVPDERLSGEFSVSATKKIRFTLGNLRYNVGSQTWDFAKNQSYVVGERNKNFDNKTYNGYIDLFSWDDLETISSIYKGKGRILSKKEWNYLLHERENADDLWGYGIVDNQEGLFLLPDNWNFSDDENFPFTSGVPYYRGWAGYDLKNTFSLDEFMRYEKKGVVFLPSAGHVDAHLSEEGHRLYTYYRGYGNGSGFYFYLNEGSEDLKYGVIEIRIKGFRNEYPFRRCSVRLVQDVK